MPSRKRRKSGAAPTPDVDPSVALFAERHRQQCAAERSAQREVRRARREAARHQSLLADKDAAAAALKDARREAATGDRLASAEAGYRAALAELVAFESGERPAWAADDAIGTAADAGPSAAGEGAPNGGSEAEPASTEAAKVEAEPAG